MLTLVIVAAYVLGAVPTGYLVVKALTGQDLRRSTPERMGAATALRVGGLQAGLLTLLLDVLKGAAAVWLASALLPPSLRPTGMAAAGLAAMLGQSVSVFMQLRGSGAAAPAVGAAFGLWPLSALIVVPIGIVVLLALRGSKLAGLAMALAWLLLFLGLYYFQGAPVAYSWFAAGALALLAWEGRSVLTRRMRVWRGG